MKLLGYIEGKKPLETILHIKYNNLRHHGEWFVPNDDLLRFIEEYSEEKNVIKKERENKMYGELSKFIMYNDDIEKRLNDLERKLFLQTQLIRKLNFDDIYYKLFIKDKK